MKKKNIFASCAVTGLLLSALVACGGNNPTSAKPESKPTSEATPSSEVAPASDPKSEAPASTPAGDSTPAPVAKPIKTWSGDETKAGMSNASADEVKDTTGDIQFAAYKLGKQGDTVTFKWTPTEAGKVAFNLVFTTKAANATNATFWYQSATSTQAKMQIAVDGKTLDTPADNPNFQDICGGADGVVESEGMADIALANPVSYKMAEFDVQAGVENSIVVTYLGGGYSFYIVGAEIFKA